MSLEKKKSKHSVWFASSVLVMEVVTLELPPGGWQTELFSSQQDTFTSLQRVVFRA